MQLDRNEQHIYNSTTMRVETPEGSMYVHIIENSEGNPVAIDINLGKAGTVIGAWARSLTRIMTIALENGATIENLIEELSLQNSDRIRRSTGNIIIRSGPAGIAYALLAYRRDKYTQKRASQADLERSQGPRLSK